MAEKCFVCNAMSHDDDDDAADAADVDVMGKYVGIVM